MPRSIVPFSEIAQRPGALSAHAHTRRVDGVQYATLPHYAKLERANISARGFSEGCRSLF